MITQEESKQINKLLNTYRWELEELNELQEVIRKHIDGGYTVCTHCSAQLRHILKRLRDWYILQEVEDKKPMEPLVETPEIDIDIKEADEQGCMKCSRKKKNKS
jgi:hypothetical protein